MTAASPSPLGPYVPRVVRDWLDDDPAALHRRLEGTIVFVDVSGFTQMSERLARFGKQGAELVTEIIGSCFNRLLTEAYRFGATLLKFGGDALLLFFQGDAHERRACAAALQMRQALRASGHFETAAGRVTLRMSVGVHSGLTDFFLVGGSHRELIVTGPAASQVVRLEGAASAGRILVSHTVAAALPRVNRGAAMGPGVLLRGPLPIEGHDDVQFRAVPYDLTPYLPVGLHDVLAEGGAPPEHRRSTVAFVHVGGVDSLLERDGPEHVARLLDDLVRTLQGAIDARRVCFLASDVASDGAKVILTAGVPFGDGEDEERLLLALRELVDASPALPVRIGVNAGHVFAGEIGTTHRRTYTVMGDAVNLAARLMARADPGQILATEPVLAVSRTLFDVASLMPFLVKGKRQPVTALAVGSPRGVRTGIAVDELPLIGRDGPLDAVLASVERLRAGEGRLVEVIGEPGVGKSRFLDEVVRRSGAMAVHRVQCRQYQAATPYFALEQLLRELLGLVDTTDADALAELARTVRVRVPHLLPWLPLLAIPFGLEDEESPEVALLTEEFRKQQLERSTVELLTAVVTEPTLICFEDAHWMDDASGDVLRALEPELAHRPWLLCVTRRAVSTGFVPTAEEATTTIELTALDAASTAGLLEVATARQPLPEHVLRALVERSDGNPLFALELLHALQTEGDLEALPQSVEGLIGARIDRLPPEDRSFLRHVSVLGAGFWDEHISTVLPEVDRSTATPALARLTDLLDVRPSGWVTFRHALVRDVAYGGLPFGARSRLHGQVAESILRSTSADPSDQAALLSLHFARAHRHAEAWRFARLAGDSARELFANIDAITLYQRAMVSARHLPELAVVDRAEVLERLGDAQDLAGMYADARASYASARRLLAADPAAQAGLLLKDAFIAERQGRYRDAVRSIRRGQRLVAEADDGESAKLRAQLMVWLGAVRADQGQIVEARRWSRAGISLSEEAEDDSALARAYLVLDYAEATLGVSNDAEHSARALDIYVRHGDLTGEATAANNLGVYAFLDGRWDQAIELYGRSREARVKAGDPAGAAGVDLNIAEILTGQGRLDEAEVLLRSAAGVCAAAGDRWSVASSQRGLGFTAARAGRFEEAAALLDEARAGFVAIGASADVVTTDLTIAESLVLGGSGAEALPVLARILVDGEMPDGHEPYQAQFHRVWGLASLQVGDTELGQRELETAVSMARGHGADHQLALALQALVRLGNQDARGEHIQIMERLGILDAPDYPLPQTAAAP